MDISNVLSLMGGLALFLYGMHMMSEGLEVAAGDKMKAILERLTSNRFIGIFVGAGITAVIQSSSATTVMVVGFVNSQLMTIKQAVWIIMGANIGTTITGQLIALDAGKVAPIIALLGVVMVSFLKNKKIQAFGEIFAGLGILFIGMSTMSAAMVPLQDSIMFREAMTTFSNPVMGILIGAIFTALIQSSSASVGILQALAISGLIPLDSAVYILFGQNIGTCVTAFLACIGASRNAKRTTIIHLSFNIIGTIVFVAIASLFPFANWVGSFTPGNPAAQIANVHTIFNITTALLLIPFGVKLAHLSEIILPITKEELEDSSYDLPLAFIDENNLGSVSIAISSLRSEAVAMLRIAEKNIRDSLDAILGKSVDIEKIHKREKRIDYINYQITDFMTKVSTISMNERDSTTCNALFKCFSDIERIGDHAINIIQYVESKENALSSHRVIEQEIIELQDLLLNSISLLFAYDFDSQDDCYERVERIEDNIDELTVRYRQAQIDRLLEKKCTAKDCVIYSEILTDIERVSDHLMNIIQECKRCNFTLVESIATDSKPTLATS